MEIFERWLHCRKWTSYIRDSPIERKGGGGPSPAPACFSAPHHLPTISCDILSSSFHDHLSWCPQSYTPQRYSLLFSFLIWMTRTQNLLFALLHRSTKHLWSCMLNLTDQKVPLNSIPSQFPSQNIHTFPSPFGFQFNFKLIDTEKFCSWILIK